MSTRRATSIPHPNAASIDEMPLEDFYTAAICLDLSHVPLKHEITVAEMEEALADTRPGDQQARHRADQHGRQQAAVRARRPTRRTFPGLHVDSVHWLADHGILMFGVEAVSPAPQGEPNFKAHIACARARHHAYRVPVEPGGRGREGSLQLHRLPVAYSWRDRQPDPRGGDVRGVRAALGHGRWPPRRPRGWRTLVTPGLPGSAPSLVVSREVRRGWPGQAGMFGVRAMRANSEDVHAGRRSAARAWSDGVPSRASVAERAGDVGPGSGGCRKVPGRERQRNAAEAQLSCSSTRIAKATAVSADGHAKARAKRYVLGIEQPHVFR